MNDIDRRLIECLQSDTRLSNAQLAEAVGISPSACWRRVKAFEEAGLVERYAAVVNPRAMGLGIETIVHVYLRRHDTEATEKFISAVQRRDEVTECWATTGQADYHLRVFCKDIDAYNLFLEEFLFAQPAVKSAQTNMVLKRIKANAPIRPA